MRCGRLMGREALYDPGVEGPEARVVAVVCARSAPAEPTGADRGPGRRGYRTHDSGGCRGGARVSLDGRLGDRSHGPVIAPPSEELHAARNATDDRRRRNALRSRADSRHPTPRGSGRVSGGRIWTENLAGGAALRFRRPVFKKPPGAPTGG